MTLAADSGWPKYQRTAMGFTSGGQRYPATAESDAVVYVRRHWRHR